MAYRGGSKQTPGEGDAESDGSLEPYDLSEEEDDGRCTKHLSILLTCISNVDPSCDARRVLLQEGLQHVQSASLFIFCL